MFRHKFGGRLAELESQLEAAKSKAARLEKEKSKMTMEIEEIMVNLDNVSSYCFSSHFVLNGKIAEKIYASSLTSSACDTAKIEMSSNKANNVDVNFTGICRNWPWDDAIDISLLTG